MDNKTDDLNRNQTPAMDTDIGTDKKTASSDKQESIEDIIKENRNLKRQLRNLESTFQRNKAMLAARTSVNNMLESDQRKMERNLTLLLKNSADIILLLDRDSRFTYFTQTFLKATGIANAGLVTGQLFSDVFKQLISNKSLEILISNIELAMEERDTVSISISFDLSGGDNLQEYDIQITPMVDQAGDLEAFMILLHNITDIMRSKRQAESANIAKSQFLATMSHEMRTPMNAVLGMTSIGKSSLDNEKMMYCFEKIEDASKHLLGVINDILDVSKIEAGKLELSSATFSFEKMLQSIVNIINYRVSEKNQILKVHIDESIPKYLIGDDQRLAQVITNLLGNAVKFTPEGGQISLRTKLNNVENENCEIQFVVSDNGIGISPEQQLNLFKSFHQAESDTSRKFGGTGLGLSISKSIVNMMSGEISIESELGKGSDFIFTIQMQKGKDKQEETSSITNWEKVRILVFDEDPDSLAIYKTISQRLGAHCDTTSITEEANRLLRDNEKYHLFFVDGNLPEDEGILIAEAIEKGASKYCNVIIMVSPSDWNKFDDEAKKAKGFRLISKPIFPSAVVDIMNEILGNIKPVEATQTTENAVYKGHNILLADDIEINREIVLALLEPTEIDIDCAENGAEALRMFDEHPEKYEMIFMDIQMPEMDGYEATSLIRAHAHSWGKAIPIIAMTANVFREDVEKCLAVGMNGHVGKPLDYDEVISILNTYLL